MASRPLHLCASALTITASGLFSALACTFPSVDYEESGTMVADACVVPAMCAMDAQKCGGDARTKFESCSNSCSNKPATCQMGCDDDLNVKLGQCNLTCQSCSLDRGCVSDTGCKVLVGG